MTGEMPEEFIKRMSKPKNLKKDEMRAARMRAARAMVAKNAGTGLLGIVLMILSIILSILLVMICWNCCMPAIFGLKVIGFKEAVALFVVVHILMGKISFSLNK